MYLDIDFDKLLSDSLEASAHASEFMRNHHPEGSTTSEQLDLIAKVSATTTIQILKQYHQQLVDALSEDESIHQQ